MLVVELHEVWDLRSELLESRLQDQLGQQLQHCLLTSVLLVVLLHGLQSLAPLLRLLLIFGILLHVLALDEPHGKDEAPDGELDFLERLAVRAVPLLGADLVLLDHLGHFVLPVFEADAVHDAIVDVGHPDEPVLVDLDLEVAHLG